MFWSLVPQLLALFGGCSVNFGWQSLAKTKPWRDKTWGRGGSIDPGLLYATLCSMAHHNTHCSASLHHYWRWNPLKPWAEINPSSVFLWVTLASLMQGNQYRKSESAMEPLLWANVAKLISNCTTEPWCQSWHITSPETDMRTGDTQEPEMNAQCHTHVLVWVCCATSGEEV